MKNLFAKLFKRKLITPIKEPISITINGITYTESLNMASIDGVQINFDKETGDVDVTGQGKQIRKSEILIGGSVYGDLDVTNCYIDVAGDVNGDTRAVRSTVHIDGKIDGNLTATDSYVKVNYLVAGNVEVYEE